MKNEKKELAFELYKSLGEKRTYSKVADLMGLSVKTIEKYGVDGKWQNRLEEECREKSERIRQQREELENLGYEVALSALKEVKKKLEKGCTDKELAQVFELYLKTPFSVNNSSASVEAKSACATSNEEKKIEIVFDINGGVSSED